MTHVVVSFVDVGQGDCTTIVDANGVGILVDCPEGKDDRAEQELSAQGCKWIKLVIASHSDRDHAGGLLDAVERMRDRFDGFILFNADSWLAAPPPAGETKPARSQRRAFLLRAMEYEPFIGPAHAGAGQRIGLINCRILAPTYGEVVSAINSGDPNIASTVVLISAFNKNVVIGGDSQIDTWERVQFDIPRDSTVRWPHHGGSISGGDPETMQRRMFDITRPARVVVSVGSGNTFGHPSDAFFNARRESGIKLLCTEATGKCVRGGGSGGVCAGTVRIVFSAEAETVSASTRDHSARIEEFGAAQCLT